MRGEPQQRIEAGSSRTAPPSSPGRLHGGYRPLSWESRWMAAVLACGAEAALSHLSAAYLWRLLDPRQGPIDVCVRSSAGRGRRDGIRIHRFASLQSSEVTQRRGIPVTTPARTIDDLRGIATEAQLRRAIRQAEMFGLRTDLEGTTDPTRSELEHLFSGSASAIDCRSPRSTSGSALASLTSSGTSSASSSRPTATAITAARRPSRTITSETWTSAAAATTWSV
jgi:hypothetical protein